jgi:hypothetical protein
VTVYGHDEAGPVVLDEVLLYVNTYYFLTYRCQEDGLCMSLALGVCSVGLTLV